VFGSAKLMMRGLPAPLLLASSAEPARARSSASLSSSLARVVGRSLTTVSRPAIARWTTVRTPASTGGVASAAPRTVEKTLDAARGGQRVAARVGQPVVITVKGDALDTVSLGEIGTKTVEPASPARFELLADTPGRYPLDLLEAGRRIGMLEVRP
jgi:hypothetical protein